MSLEMIASPEFPLLDTPAADMLESLCVLDRCHVTHGAERMYENIVSGSLSPEKKEDQLTALRNMLLSAARAELCEVRQQLTLWQVIWRMLWHRDERAIRKLYLRLRERQRFHDGARVAELLVAVRQTLLEGKKPGPELSGSLQIADYISAAGPYKSAINIAAVVISDSVKAKQTRWWSGQCRTPSWQAAYNTACLYAALRQHHLRRPGSYRLRARGHVYELGGQGDKALCLTMTIGCLVAQVCREPAAGSQAVWPTSKPDTGVITIFPPQPEPVPWPPPNQLDEESLITLEDLGPLVPGRAPAGRGG